MRLPLILVCCLIATAAAIPENSLRWQALHERGVAGDKAAVVELIDLLQTTLEKEPGQQLARVYLGSACTLRSRDLGLGMAKLDFLRKGGRLMDEAVAAAPDNARVRLVRAINSYELPVFLNRRKVAREDFRVLLAAIDRDRSSVAREVRQAILFYAGQLEADEGEKSEAENLWRRALAAAPDSTLAPAIRKTLPSPSTGG